MKTFDDLMNQYDRGALNRRQLLQGLAMLVVTPAAAAAQAPQADRSARARSITYTSW